MTSSTKVTIPTNHKFFLTYLHRQSILYPHYGGVRGNLCRLSRGNRHKYSEYDIIRMHHTDIILSKRYRIPKCQSKMDNPEKLATQGTQDDEKQNKNTTQYALDTTICNQTQIT